MGGGAGSTSASGAAPAGLALSPDAAGSRPAAITRLHASRSYIIAKRHGSHAMIVVTFRLRHRARVFFTLVQVAPKCRVVASFSVMGHRGTNRIRLGDGAARRKLLPGTYRLAARTPHGSSVLYTTLLVANHRPTQAQLTSAMQANACAAAQQASVRLVRGAIASIFGSPPGTSSRPAVSRAPAGAAASGTLGVAAHAQPDLGALSPANLSKNATDPVAIAALGAALLLLGLAALPRAAIPDRRLTDLIVRYRAEVLVAGAAAFVAAVIVLTIH